MQGFIPGKTFALLKSVNSHAHKEGWEIILNLSGAGREVIGVQNHDFQPGSIVCVPPNMPHFKSAVEGFEDIFILSGDSKLFPGESAIFTSDDEAKSIEHLCGLLHYCYFRDGGQIRRGTAALFDAMIQLLYDRIELPNVNRYAEALQRRIIEHFTDPEFLLASAMTESGLCSDHLRRLFKKEYGITPLDYLNHLRIEHAKALLRSSRQMQVSEIALSSGFYDPHYFSRLFKAHTGCLPRNYRS